MSERNQDIIKSSCPERRWIQPVLVNSSVTNIPPKSDVTVSSQQAEPRGLCTCSPGLLRAQSEMLA